MGLILKKIWENIGKWKLNEYKICKRSRVLDRNSFGGEKNEEFSFLIKLIYKLVCLTNVVILDNVFSFKISNAAITNYGFEFDLIVVVLYSGI